MADKLLSGRRILVVEDEMLILLLIEEMLDDLGYASITATATVEKALAAIKMQVFDAALLDVNLNGEKSYPVANALAALGVPFAFSTGYSDHAMTEGYRDYPVLKKPYQVRDLVTMFTRLLSSSRIPA